MRTIIKKVDGVQSVAQALELESLGADFIGLSICGNNFSSGKECVDKSIAVSIRKVLKRAKLIGEIKIESDLTMVIDLIKEVEFDYVKVKCNGSVPLEFKKKLDSMGVGIIYGGIKATSDDDPSWIMSGYGKKTDTENSFFQIDLFEDINNSWNFLKHESPKYKDELQIRDIIQIGEEYPLIISLDFNINNVSEIIDEINSIKGINMMICESDNINYGHYFNYSTAIEVLKRLNN